MQSGRLHVYSSIAAAAIALSACGGGGGGGTSGGGGGGLPPTPTATPALTNASGKVVSDTNGAALGGVKVALRPWAGCSTPTPTSLVCPTPLPAPQTTTAPDGTFTLTGAPNGHYFLVIGDDAPGSSTTTVHDSVTLAGGTQTLSAPNMPPVPQVTSPAWETSGNYRIEMLDATTESPCMTEFNAQRVSHSLPQVVADQWLLESSRAFQGNTISSSPSSPPWPGNANGILADTYDGLAGGTQCKAMVDAAFGDPNSPSIKITTTWYGGFYQPTVYGVEQEMGDPITDPSTKGVVWP